MNGSDLSDLLFFIQLGIYNEHVHNAILHVADTF